MYMKQNKLRIFPQINKSREHLSAVAFSVLTFTLRNKVVNAYIMDLKRIL